MKQRLCRVVSDAELRAFGEKVEKLDQLSRPALRQEMQALEQEMRGWWARAGYTPQEMVISLEDAWTSNQSNG